MAKPRVIYAVRNQMTLEATTLDDLIDPQHVVRDIWAYVEALDLSELYERIGSREGASGAPCFDPRTLLCLWIYATVDGVGSARRLSRLLEDHVVYRWIAGGEVINYHTLSSFRSQNESMLDRLLSASVAVLAQEGLIDRDSMTVAHDGMRVRASAGRSSMRRRASLERLLGQAKARVEQFKTQDDEAPTARHAAARERAARERLERLNEALAVMDKLEARQQPRSDRKPKEPRASTTDPDATTLRMANGGKDVAHNVQFTTEVTTRVITSVHIAPLSSDTGTLLPAMEGHASGHGCLPSCVLADGGFFKYEDIAALERDNCTVTMPDIFAKRKKPPTCAKDDRPLVESWIERMATTDHKKVNALQGSTVEWANACARQQGLLQLNVRGFTKVRAVALLHALTHNIRRTLALLRGNQAEQLA